MLAVVAAYPSSDTEEIAPYIQTMMVELRRQGAQPTVIAPRPFRGPLRWSPRLKRGDYEETRDGIRILRPTYTSYSNKILPAGISTFRWTVVSFRRAVQRASKYIERPDICYGHFLYPSGVAAHALASAIGCGSVVALGESSFESYEDHFGIDRVRHDLSKISRIVAVSESNMEVCTSRYGVSPARIGVFPNGVDLSRFRSLDRAECRKSLGLPEERPIIIFAGHFLERKGPLRVMEAISGREDIGAIFLGSGPMIPEGPQVLFRGAVPHDEMPRWLNAADMFVLPTLAEGSPNAIIEAMACGLPVVSSDLPFNHEFLDSSSGILIDPADIAAIRRGILSLVDDKGKREALGKMALERALHFGVSERARHILEWIAPVCR